MSAASSNVLNAPTTGLHTAWEKTKAFGQASKTYLSNAKDYVIREIWQNTLEKKLEELIGSSYKYRIKPLYKDAPILIGCAVAAVVIAKIALATLGLGILPFAIGAGVLIVFGGYYFADHRLTRLYNKQAWDKLDLMRRYVFKEISPGKKDVGQLSIYIEELKKPQFNHLKQPLIDSSRDSIISQLEDRTNMFIKRLKYDYEGNLKVAKGFLTYLGTTKTPSKQLAKLKTELDKAGTKDYSKELVEKYCNQLTNLEDADRKRLREHIDRLHEAINYPSHKDSKEAYIKYIESLQSQICYSEKIESLQDIQDTHVDLEEEDQEDPLNVNLQEELNPEETLTVDVQETAEH